MQKDSQDKQDGQAGHSNSQHSENGHNHGFHHQAMADDFKRRFWICLVLTAPVIVLSPMLGSLLGWGRAVSFTGDMYLLLALSSLIFIYGGWPFLKGMADEVGKKQPGMMTLVAVAISVAYIYSALVALGLEGKVFFWELASLIVIMLLGHWIEMRSVMSASSAMEELAKLVPKKAHRKSENGKTEEVSVSELSAGDLVLVKPGEQVPSDGEVKEGQSSLNESLLTGESNPVAKKPGDEVIGGSINGEGSLTVEVTKTGEDSFLNQVIDLVEKAQESKSRSQGLADRAAMWLTFIALGAGGLTLAGWLILSGHSLVFAVERMVTVMVITCPHALGLAVPLVVAVSTSLAAGRGFLIRNRTPFEFARNLQAIVFDKTGTLTKGEFSLSDTLVFSDELDEDELIKLAASVESRSEHPLARPVAEAAEQTYEVTDFESIPGKGATAEVEGKAVLVVSPAYLEEQEITYPQDRVTSLQEEGKTVIMVAREGKALGALALGDTVRDESRQAVDRLQDMGLKVMMLTGDNQAAAAWVADQLGIEDYFAGVVPQDKADKIKEIQGQGLKVGMTGDGVNDAPALAQADLGMAIGAGTDVAVETADVVLVKNRPLDVVKVIELSRATHRKTVQNLFWATGYNALAIPLAAGALYSFGIVLNPAVGALLMSISTVIVAVNARLLHLD